MKIKRLLLTVVISGLSLSISAQNKSADAIRNNYPQVYSSIAASAEKQWGSDTKTKNAVIEGQAQAFLSVQRSVSSTNNNLMRSAIEAGSLAGTKDGNIIIMNDYPMEEALPRLQCDWYRVQMYLKKNAGAGSSPVQTQTAKKTEEPTYSNNRVTKEPVGSGSTVTETIITKEPVATNNNTRVNKPNRENEVHPALNENTNTYPTRRSQQEQAPSKVANDADSKSRVYSRYERQRQQENDKYFQKQQKDSQFKIGAKIGLGESSMYNLGNYANNTTSIDGVSPLQNLQLKSLISVTAEAGIVFSYKTKGFLIQNETTIHYLMATFKNKLYSPDGKITESPNYNNKYINLRTAFHLGGYTSIGEETQLIFGVGPYVEFNLNSDYDTYGIFERVAANAENKIYERYMKDAKKNLQFGLSGMIGLEMEDYRIGLYPSIGLSKMYENQDYKPFGATFGFTYFFY